MADVTEIMQMCRLCLVKEQVNIPIFEEPGDVHEVLLKISACLPVKVSREDNLPKKVCDGCGYKLDLLYQFWNTASNAEKQLVQWLTAAGVDPKHNSTAEDILAAVQPKVVLKQEPNADDSLSLDTQSYILQQQQIPVYQQKDEFKEYTPTTTTTTTTTVPTPAKKKATASPAAKAPASKRPKRATRSKRAVKDSSEDEDDLPLAKAAITKTEQVAIESDDDDGDMGDMGDPDFGTGDDEDNDTDQPGPSGVGKSSNDAPCDVWSERKKYFFYLNGKCCGRHIVRKGDFYCQHCNTPDKYDGYQLRLHYLEKHPGKTLIHMKVENFLKMSPVCEICNNQFGSLVEVDNHLETHDYQYKCTDCEKQFKSIFEYSLHLYEHSKSYTCQLCEFKTNTKKPLYQHYQGHLKSLRPYLCEEPGCNTRWPNISNYYLHQATHSDVRTLQCEICANTFKTHQSLRSHRHHMHADLFPRKNEIGVDFICTVCNIQLATKKKLIYHMRSHQTRVVCDICGKGFLTNFHMKRHKASHGEKIHQCSYCEQKFSRKEYLKDHEHTHTGARPYLCRFCGQGFTQGGPRRTHEKNFHANAKLLE